MYEKTKGREINSLIQGQAFSKEEVVPTHVLLSPDLLPLLLLPEPMELIMKSAHVSLTSSLWKHTSYWP